MKHITTFVFAFYSLALSAAEDPAFGNARAHLDNILEIMDQNSITEGRADLHSLRHSPLLNPSDETPVLPIENLVEVKKRFKALIIATGIAERLVLSGLVTPEILNTVIPVPASTYQVRQEPKSIEQWERSAIRLASEMAVAIASDDAKMKYVSHLRQEQWTDKFKKFQDGSDTRFGLTMLAGIFIVPGNLAIGMILKSPLANIIFSSVIVSIPYYFGWHRFENTRSAFWKHLKKAGITLPTDLPIHYRDAWLKSILTDTLEPELFWRYNQSSAQATVTNMKSVMKNDYPCKINLAAIGVKGP
jgi:hypothetical protein